MLHARLQVTILTVRNNLLYCSVGFDSPQLGYDGHLCATGKGCTVEFYDLRKAGKPLGTYSECHTDAVTQVRIITSKWKTRL